jgi:hypothetical protein
MGVLEDYLDGIVSDALYDMEGKPVDWDKLREEADDHANDAAGNACIYYHNAERIIDDYETHPYADPEGIGCDEVEYPPSRWLDAMQRYAECIAHTVLTGLVGEAINTLEEEFDTFATFLEDSQDELRLPADVNRDDIRIFRDCPYGYFAHDYETDDGIHVWKSRQCDGLNAAAMRASHGVWFGVSWTPTPSATPEG